MACSCAVRDVVAQWCIENEGEREGVRESESEDDVRGLERRQDVPRRKERRDRLSWIVW